MSWTSWHGWHWWQVALWAVGVLALNFAIARWTQRRRKRRAQ